MRRSLAKFAELAKTCVSVYQHNNDRAPAKRYKPDLWQFCTRSHQITCLMGNDLHIVSRLALCAPEVPCVLVLCGVPLQELVARSICLIVVSVRLAQLAAHQAQGGGRESRPQQAAPHMAGGPPAHMACCRKMQSGGAEPGSDRITCVSTELCQGLSAEGTVGCVGCAATPCSKP